MTARTHDLAAVTGLGLVFILSQPVTVSLGTAILTVLANLIGGITPDIDQPTAPFWRNLPIGGFFGRIVDRMLGGHRFVTHSMLGLLLFGFGAHWLLVFLSPIMRSIDIGYVWWGFMIGMLSHLVMDSLTKEGVPWLLPIPIKFGLPPIRRLRLTTGKLGETWLVFPGLLAFNIVFYYSNYQLVLDILHRHIV